jgi:hypothetical protein
MVLVLIAIFIVAHAAELLKEYFFRRQMKNRITELQEYRLLAEKVKELPGRERKDSRVVIESDGYIGTLAISQKSAGKYSGKSFLQHYYFFVLDKQSRSVKLVTPLT